MREDLIKRKPHTTLYELEEAIQSTSDSYMELVLAGSLLALLFLIGTPLFQCFSSVNESTPLQIIKEG